MKKILIFALTAVCLLTLVFGLCSCQSDDVKDELVAIEGDNVTGVWIIGGTGNIDDDRLDKIVTAYNGITELEKYEEVSEKDATMMLVIFSDRGEGATDIFKICYTGDNTFSISVNGASEASYNAVSEELFRAITEKID